MHCVKEIQTVWKSQSQATNNSSNVPKYSEKDMDPQDLRILYPGKTRQDYDQKLRRKDTYLYKRPRTLPAKSK